MNVNTKLLHVVTSVDRSNERRIRDAIDGTPGRHTLVVGATSARQPLARLSGRIEVIQLPLLSAAGGLRADAVVTAQIVALARRRIYAVIHSHSPRANLICRAVARATHVPIVCESSYVTQPGEGVEGGRLDVRTRGTVGTFFVETDAARDRLIASGVSTKHVAVVRTSVPLKDCHPVTADERTRLRRFFDLDPDVATVTFAARLDKANGADVIRQVVAEAAGGAPVQLLVAGDGPLVGELVDGTGEDGVTVRALGAVDSDVSAIRAADALVLPRSVDRLAPSIVEAAACLVPIVTYAGEGVDEVMRDGARGRVVTRGDRQALSGALGELLGQGPADPPDSDAGDGNRIWNQWSDAVISLAYRWHYESNALRPLNN